MSLEAKVTRIEAKLSRLLDRTSRETWVKSHWITELTGWDWKKMNQARRDNLIKFRQNGKRYEYLLESVPEQFIIKKATA